MILQLAPLDASYSYDCECLNVKYRKVLSDPKDVGRILHCNFTLRILNASRKPVYLYVLRKIQLGFKISRFVDTRYNQ